MTPQDAIPIIERLQEPEAWEPQISRDAYEALELAIEALEKQIPMPMESGKRVCGSCGTYVAEPASYCWWCGQRAEKR